MIKILHTGDIHLGDLAGPTKDGENLRRLDTLRCMDSIVERARVEDPNVTIIAGDLFNRSRVWADTALDDVNDALERFIRPLCEYSDAVVLLFGTMNHDNPRAFEVIRKAAADLDNLHIYTTPTLETLSVSGEAVDIVAVPGFDKARLRLFCPGDDQETENRNATALINNIILGLSTEIDHSRPSIMVAHYTVSGSEADNGSTFLAGQDVVILPSTIDAAGVDLACFGHIHKPQKLLSNVPAYYCGSPNQLTFNDEGTDHGFWMHAIQKGGVKSEFVQTPERRHFTLAMSDKDVTDFISSGEYIPPEAAAGAVVRVRYTCTPEQDKAMNRAALQKLLTDAGAFYVAEIVPENIKDLDVKDNLTEHDGPVECLSRWMEFNEVSGEKAARLLELAAPIIKQADDGRDDGKNAGIFTPRTIEVKNYRSYTEASFDFEPIHMAMVNGQNGVGKSSMFMDAIADCLYEQTRKEDIGGWVRDGTKSGAITFTFSMGSQDYRVIRTRTKAGRGTLALQRYAPESGVWADESDTTMKLTQAKIERLLGMDCNTFCSIALIRQDAYGLFLDADSDRRMEVLSSLLGLDIYTRMEDIARAFATEQRRKIAAVKERINILGEQISAKTGLLEDDAALATKGKETADAIAACEAELKMLEQTEALALEIARQAETKEVQGREYAADCNRKGAELARLKVEYLLALEAKDGVETAREAAEKVKAARLKIQELTPQADRERELLSERVCLNNEVAEACRRIIGYRADVGQYKSILGRKAEIEAAQAVLADIAPKLQAAHLRLAEAQKAAGDKQKAKAAVDGHVADSRIRIGELEARLKAAQAEAVKLEDSGCPNPETATCKFLVSAVAAQAAIPELSTMLEQTKIDDRARYTELMAAYNEAKAKDEDMGDPAAEVVTLGADERKYREVADLAPRLAAAQAGIEKIESSISEEQGKAEQAEARVREIDAELAELAGALEEYRVAREIVAANEHKADMLAACEAAAAKAEALAPQIERLQSDITELMEKSAQAEKEAGEIRTRIPTPAGNTAGLRAILSAQRQTITNYATQRGEISAKLKAITEAEAQTAELRQEAERIGVMLNDYITLVQAFGIDGIQYMIIRGVVPEIMRQSNDILTTMTGGRMAVDFRTEREQKSTKTIVNSLEVWINTITGGTRPYQSHSGGEKVKIALAVTLGLADVKARRAGIQLGMLFIDEPPFLDADGTEAYADALVSMATRNPNMRILAISHDPTMKARFSQNIIVTGGEDGSSVTME
jgi:exonuclease SbcD